jgi:hypothetical protein
VVYKPTVQDSFLALNLHYNNSSTPRPNAITSDRGMGFTVTAGGPAQLNLRATRSALGEATGLATAYFAGRRDVRSAGADQHLALAFSGTQGASDGVTLYGVALEGAG